MDKSNTNINAENINFYSNYNLNTDEINIKNANLISNNSQIIENQPAINRKFILDYLNNNNNIKVWSLDNDKKIPFIISKFSKLKELLIKTKIIYDDFSFSERQKFIIEDYLSLSENEIKDNFLKDLSNNARFKNYIIEMYWSVYDVIEDYKQYKSEHLFKQEYDVIFSVVNSILKISSDIINS